MTNLRLIDPLINDPFESALRRFFSPSMLESEAPALRMPVDVAERDGIYEIKADLPGIKKESINVRIDGNVVQIDALGTQDKETAPANQRLLRRERYLGNITRTFSMAEDIDDAKVQAKYADGVLTLELPKKASAAVRKIAIQ